MDYVVDIEARLIHLSLATICMLELQDLYLAEEYVVKYGLKYPMADLEELLEDLQKVHNGFVNEKSHRSLMKRLTYLNCKRLFDTYMIRQILKGSKARDSDVANELIELHILHKEKTI